MADDQKETKIVHCFAPGCSSDTLGLVLFGWFALISAFQGLGWLAAGPVAFGAGVFACIGLIVVSILQFRVGDNFMGTMMGALGFMVLSMSLVHVWPALGLTPAVTANELFFLVLTLIIFFLFFVVAMMYLPARLMIIAFLVAIVAFVLQDLYFVTFEPMLLTISGVLLLPVAFIMYYFAAGGCLHKIYGREMWPTWSGFLVTPKAVKEPSKQKEGR